MNTNVKLQFKNKTKNILYVLHHGEINTFVGFFKLKKCGREFILLFFNHEKNFIHKFMKKYVK